MLHIYLSTASSVSSFTADQWKHWVVYFSLISLHDILHGDHLECWCHFVLACRILCQRNLTTEQVRLADALLLQFCRRTERLYGHHVVTPNMHMHCHLRACIEDFGPLHGFWCYAFERYNGLLGDTPNNNRTIEAQLMHRFIVDNSVSSISLPTEFSEEFNTTLLVYLQQLYSKLYLVPESAIVINRACLKYSSVHLCGKLVGSHQSRSANSSIIMAMWYPEMFGSLPSTFSSFEVPTGTYAERPARINYIIKHTIVIHNKHLTHVLLALSWFKLHPKKNYGAVIYLKEGDYIVWFQHNFLHFIN